MVERGLAVDHVAICGWVQNRCIRSRLSAVRRSRTSLTNLCYESGALTLITQTANASFAAIFELTAPVVQRMSATAHVFM